MKKIISFLIIANVVLLSGCVNDVSCPRNHCYTHVSSANYRTNVTGGYVPMNGGQYAVNAPRDSYYSTGMLHSHHRQAVSVETGATAG